MAQLLIIKAETAKDGLQYIGDVVGVYSDSHVFTDHELSIFDVLVVNGSQQDVNARLRQLSPAVETAFLWPDGDYRFESPDVQIGAIQVYQLEGGSRWYKAENDFKFPVNIDGLTPEEKQLLETVDINHPSVDSFARKLVKDITGLTGNSTEIKELRNVNP